MLPTVRQLLTSGLSNDWDEQWRRLCAELFDTLCRSLGQGSQPRTYWQEMQSLGERWRSCIEDKQNWPEEIIASETARRQYMGVHDLLLCTEYADLNRNELGTGLGHAFLNAGKYDGLIQKLSHPPDAMASDWAWGCMRSLLGHRSSHTRTIAFALHDKQRGGLIAHLLIEILPWLDAALMSDSTGPDSHDLELRSIGSCFQHPAIAVLEAKDLQDNAFHTSIANAWQEAGRLARERGIDTRCDGRWQVVGDDVSTMSSISGASASGAAALGFFHALCGTYPDEELIVLAQIDKHGELSEVDKIGPKVAAIVKDGRFDTIVVAGEENEGEARVALEEARDALGQASAIRVINLAAMQEAL